MSKPVKVAFLGPESTYTHQAVVQQFGSDPKEVEILPQSSIPSCLDRLHQKEADYAVVPFENSTNGQVVYTYDLLRDWFVTDDKEEKAQFTVVAEQLVGIHHYLFSNASDMSKVNKLYSHPQVWGQVSEFFNRTKFSAQLTKVDTDSTAQAAEKVYNDDTNTSACISSRMSGELYHLPTKAAKIEDIQGNTTRFLVLGYGSMLKHEAGKDSKDRDSKPEVHMTSLMFVPNKDDPCAITEALHVFRTNNLKISSAASRPTRKSSWEYLFYVDVEGSSETTAVQKSIDDLQKYCSEVVVLGSFLRSWRYKKQ